MRAFIIRRFFTSLLALSVASMVIFGASRLLGDPRHNLLPQQGYGFNEVEWKKAGDKLHLNDPIPIQYAYWVYDVIRGDFGQDLIDRHRINKKIVPRLWPTAMLAGFSWVIATLIGIPLGILSAVKRNTIWDLMGRIVAMLGYSLPTFWVGILLILIFAVWLRWLPAATMGTGGGFPLKHIILPSITLGWVAMAGYVRLVRSSMLEIMDSEYIKLARAKGVSENIVIWKHGFRNAAIAPLTYGGLLLAGLITGSVAAETVFAWPGIARWAVEAIWTNNLPVLVATTLVFTVAYIVLNFLVDILYVFVNPRVRY